MTKHCALKQTPMLFTRIQAKPPTAARKICAVCKVRIQCLEYALKHGEPYGIWGGLSERERRRLKHGGAA